jgi:hypothetical protein
LACRVQAERRHSSRFVIGVITYSVAPHTLLKYGPVTVSRMYKLTKRLGLLAVVAVYASFAWVYSQGTADDYYWENNDFFFTEHWTVAWIAAGIVLLLSVADFSTRGSHDRSWRCFGEAIIATGLAALFFFYVGAFVMIDWASSSSNL